MNLIRVPYGKKNTKKADREYQINGKGPVGTVKEFELAFPNLVYKIIEKEALQNGN